MMMSIPLAQLIDNIIAFFIAESLMNNDIIEIL
jgi:hypothetical protein